MTATHCPENNLNLRRKGKPVTAGANATICQVFVHKFSIRPRNQLYVYSTYRCICSIYGRLGFYAQIHINVRTVYVLLKPLAKI